MSWLYNVVVLLGFLFSYPFMLWQTLRRGKRYPTLAQRFGTGCPDPQGHSVVWIHAVSVGEVKAVRLLARALKTPGTFLLVTTASVTGQEEARRSIPEADAVRFLPLDLSWILRSWARRLRPRLLVLAEGDVWVHLLESVQREGGKTALVSGRFSERSARRWRWAPFFARRLYGHLDVLCMQSRSHAERIKAYVEPGRLHVTGNLKMSATAPTPKVERITGLQPLVIALSCTHAPEEEELLSALQGVEATIFLVPRHPERFDDVARHLEKLGIPFTRWSSREFGKRVILVDAMGQLPAVYAHSTLAILAGSFASKVGGHNILEPVLQGVPVFFGPHMHSQKELVSYVVSAGAGKQVTSAELAAEVGKFVRDPEPWKKAARGLSARSSGVLDETLRAVTAR